MALPTSGPQDSPPRVFPTPGHAQELLLLTKRRGLEGCHLPFFSRGTVCPAMLCNTGLAAGGGGLLDAAIRHGARGKLQPRCQRVFMLLAFRPFLDTLDASCAGDWPATACLGAPAFTLWGGACASA
eukprot:354069-Chlamydomonas_euryale.AAC.19